MLVTIPGSETNPCTSAPCRPLVVIVASRAPNSWMFTTVLAQHLFNGTIALMASDAGSGNVNFVITANANFANPLYKLVGSIIRAGEESTWNNLLNNVQSYCGGGIQ